MINYKTSTWRKLRGDFKGKIADIEAVENQYYDPSKDNSTDYVLNITFNLEDPETAEIVPFVQKFVAPLTGGSSLFQQLLDAKGFEPDIDGGSMDENSLVGLKLIVTMEENKKGFDTVKRVAALPQTAKAVATPAKAKPLPKLTKSTAKEEVDVSDLPF